MASRTTNRTTSRTTSRSTSRTRGALHAALAIVAAGSLVVVLASCGRGGSGGDAGQTPPPPPRGTAVTPINAGVDPVGRSRPGSITVDGHERTFRVYVPSNLPTDRAVPLLLALHGGTGSGQQFERNSQFDRLAEANGFVVAYPDGTGVGPTDSLKTWNGGRCCGSAMNDDVDDVAFLSALVDEIEQTYRIDTGQVFATGHSNGAIMAMRLACEAGDRIAAVGIYAGSLEVDGCNPSTPVSLLQIHGTADDNIPIDGGQGGRSIAGIDFRPPRQAAETFAGLDGCSAPQTGTDGAVTTTAWRSCRGGTEVDFVAIDGANHAWPAGPQTAVQERLVGKAFADFDASTEIWAFLAAHPRR